MSNRILILIVAMSVVVSGITGGLVGWAAASVATAQGVVGTDGAAGSDGESGDDGEPGATGTAGLAGGTGAAGTQGARGATGATGAVGPTGARGPAGSDGSSAPSFSLTANNGVFAERNGTRSEVLTDGLGTPFVIPAGPTLVGYSLALSSRSFYEFDVSCSMVDGLGNDFAKSGVSVVGGNPNIYAVTTVYNLPADTTLTLTCASTDVAPDQDWYYEALSIFAISFAD